MKKIDDISGFCSIEMEGKPTFLAMKRLVERAGIEGKEIRFFTMDNATFRSFDRHLIRLLGERPTWLFRYSDLPIYEYSPVPFAAWYVLIQPLEKGDSES